MDRATADRSRSAGVATESRCLAGARGPLPWGDLPAAAQLVGAAPVSVFCRAACRSGAVSVFRRAACRSGA